MSDFAEREEEEEEEETLTLEAPLPPPPPPPSPSPPVTKDTNHYIGWLKPTDRHLALCFVFSNCPQKSLLLLFFKTPVPGQLCRWWEIQYIGESRTLHDSPPLGQLWLGKFWRLFLLLLLLPTLPPLLSPRRRRRRRRCLSELR